VTHNQTQSFLTRYANENKNKETDNNKSSLIPSSANAINVNNQEILPFEFNYGNKIMWDDDNQMKRGGGSAATDFHKSKKSPKKEHHGKGKRSQERESHSNN
jgi:hypothetical protein